MTIRSITPEFAVAPQISAEDIAVIAARGFKMVICNRPDGEDSGQPPADDIRQLVEAQGMAWRFVPVHNHVGITPENLKGMRDALREAEGPVLAYCRSGTRSGNLFMATRAIP